MSRVSPRLLALVASLTLSAGCASAGQFVWLQDYRGVPASPASGLIAAGDLLSVKVWNADQLASRQRVRDDGTIALFFADGLRVAGLTTAQAADSIAARLDGILVAPRVNVVLEEAAADVVSVIGEVVRPGRYPTRDAPTVLAALSTASGLTEFARKDRIFVLRGSPSPERIRVTYEQLLQGDDLAREFRLRPGDAVIVE